MGGAIGLLLGGALTELLDWRWCLYVSVVFARPGGDRGARACCATSPRPNRPRLDVRGALTASTGLFALVFGLSRAETDGWGDPLDVACLVAQRRPARRLRRRSSGGRAAAAAAAGRRRPRPRRLVPRDRHRQRGAVRPLPVPDVLPAGTKGFSAFETGLAFLPMSFSIAPDGRHRHARSVLPRTGPRPLVPAGMLLGALGMLLLTRIGVDTAYAVARPAVADPDRHRLRADARAVVRDRHPRRARRATRRRLGDGQHLAADRRLDRHRAAEHGRRRAA